MSTLPCESAATAEVICEVRNRMGCITLNRVRALNALSLEMVRTLMHHLVLWRDDPAVQAVIVRGNSKDGPFGNFCAGGDIRQLHAAALAGHPMGEDFFTEEYTLDHLIFTYPKPYIAFMDGIVMGGGMGISQGARLRIVTERTRLAMPETLIGLFPDVGGGYFLSRCPGHTGEWLGLTGESLGAADAITLGLADVYADAASLPHLWQSLCDGQFADAQAVLAHVRSHTRATAPTAPALSDQQRQHIDRIFALPSVREIITTLEAESATNTWAGTTAQALRKRSPLMLHVVLEQVRRARSMDMAQDLRMERDLVRHCFHLRPGQSETVEGIRALAIDKDQSPRWNPPRIEDVSDDMWQPFFQSPWPAAAHPLAALKD